MSSSAARSEAFAAAAAGRARGLAPGIAVLTAWSALVAWMIPHHEPWADEAQAWELARSVGVHSLLARYLHYEISPGLWHGLLWAWSRAHGSYTGMHWLVAGLMLGAMALLVFRAPLPWPLRLVLPFTYFFVYQYAVVARSYSLFAPLLFALACVWERRWERPLPVAVLLGLLANVSVHGLAMALGLALVAGLERWQGRGERQGSATAGKSRSSWAGAAAVFVAMAVFAGWCLLPPADAEWVRGMQGATQNQARMAGSAQAMTWNHPWVQRAPLAAKLTVGLLYRFRDVTAEGLAARFFLGSFTWLAVGWYWWRTRQLRYALPVLALGLLCTFTRTDVYHLGLFWVLLVFLLWVTTKQAPGRELWARRGMLGLVMVCALIQVGWSVRAMRYDADFSYSANRDGAVVLERYLARGYRVDVAVPERRGEPLHGEFFVTGLEPYFAQEPIDNMRARFWIWRDDAEMRARYLEDTARRSVAVIVEESAEDKRYVMEETRLTALGYRRDAKVCGRAFYPHFLGPQLCHAFYLP